MLDLLVEEDDHYGAAHLRAMDMMATAGAAGAPSWTRDELHER